MAAASTEGCPRWPGPIHNANVAADRPLSRSLVHVPLLVGIPMAFLRNDAVNRVNLHSGIQALAQGAGGIFFLVFLLRSGVSVPVALLAMAAIVAGRFLFRPALLPLAKRYGLKPLLIVGTLGVALQYPLLAEVQGVGVALLALCIVSALGDDLLLAVLPRLLRGDRRFRAPRPSDRRARGAHRDRQRRRAAARRMGAGHARPALDVRRHRPGPGRGRHPAARRAQRRGEAARRRAPSRRRG